MVRRNTEVTDRFSDLVNTFAPPTTDSADDLVYNFNDIPILENECANDHGELLQLTLTFLNIR